MSTGATIGLNGDALPARPVVPIRINLLPHRERRRGRRKKDFIGLVVLVAIAGAVSAFAGGAVINQQIATQKARNEFVKAENAKLDLQIAEIKTLREEIAALKARQQAVENLQSDRTLPVHLLQELVRLTPEGLYLRTLKQTELKVVLTGHAQSNERVADLLRNLAENSPWLERPELSEIKEVAFQQPGQERGARDAQGRKIYEFTLNALVKRQQPPPDAKTPPARTTATGPVQVGSAR
jgi:type IV pilus assembly protein PilN